jgi:hypothetical protein
MIYRYKLKQLREQIYIRPQPSVTRFTELDSGESWYTGQVMRKCNSLARPSLRISRMLQIVVLIQFSFNQFFIYSRAGCTA